jgi:hypothetical protein
MTIAQMHDSFKHFAAYEAETASFIEKLVARSEETEDYLSRLQMKIMKCTA